MRKLLAFLAFATLPSLAFAGEIRIPADQPDLEAALLVAVAGDVILVQTPADQNVNASAGSSGPIRITQPVTIIGDPVCTLNFGYSATGLLLDGPGAGEVILMNVTMNTIIGATSWSPKIHGGGFDSLSLYGFQGLNYFEATTGDGAHSVDLPTIANITMVDSALNTTPVGTDSDSQCIGFFPYHWVPGYGINAPQASILLIDSSVTGGWGAKGGGFDYFEGPCPPDLSIYGGQGGHGIVAKNVHSWNSTILGGTGATFRKLDNGCGTSGSTFCGKQVDGQNVIASGTYQVNGCSRLTQASSTVALGADLVLNWDPLTAACAPAFTGCGTNCPGFLFATIAAPVAPYPLFGGLVFLDPQVAVPLGTFDASMPTQWTWTIPDHPALTNTPITAQVALANGELSGPTHLRLSH